jgi:hypothetical protein
MHDNEYLCDDPISHCVNHSWLFLLMISEIRNSVQWFVRKSSFEKILMRSTSMSIQEHVHYLEIKIWISLKPSNNNNSNNNNWDDSIRWIGGAQIEQFNWWTNRLSTHSPDCSCHVDILTRTTSKILSINSVILHFANCALKDNNSRAYRKDQLFFGQKLFS